MTDEEYQFTQNHLMTLAHLSRAVDITGFLERISLAETVGPILDPTLYLKASSNLHNLKRLAQALRPFQAEIQRQLEEGTP